MSCSSAVKSRREFFEKYVKGRDVLNLGCVETSANEFLQAELSRTARGVTGVDINREGLKKMSADGYTVAFGDVQAPGFSMNRKFDVVVAGEIIEHIDNAGIFLKNVKNHLRKGGVLLLSTPNARQVTFHMNRVLGRIRDESEVENRDHVLIHSKHTITTLLARHGFSVQEFTYLQMYTRTRKKAFLSLITRFFPEFCEGMVLAAKVRD